MNSINYRIDNLQYCNWSEEIFKINRQAGLDAIHVTIAYHEGFDDVLKNDETNKFVMSKGHACLAYYSALCEVGYISKDELLTFEKDNSNLLGHPVRNKDLGIEFSNGSLGMGLSLGIGLALSAKKRNKDFKVYVIVGDGECNEGSVWEAAMAAPNYNL